jgi:hypothetical protein
MWSGEGLRLERILEAPLIAGVMIHFPNPEQAYQTVAVFRNAEAYSIRTAFGREAAAHATRVPQTTEISKHRITGIDGACGIRMTQARIRIA